METMEYTINQDLLREFNIRSNYFHSVHQTDVAENNNVFDKLVAEGCKNFFDYLKRLGLDNDPDLIVLPPTHHYYYEADDLVNIKTLVNLNQLNNIKQLMHFFDTIFYLLPSGSYFIGCFVDNKNPNGFKSSSRRLRPIPKKRNDTERYDNPRGNSFLYMLGRLLDFRFSRYLTRRSVTLLLEEAALKVLDMADLKGLTYFCAQKV
jgi:hypothetical protein